MAVSNVYQVRFGNSRNMTLKVSRFDGTTYQWYACIHGAESECYFPLETHHDTIARSLISNLPEKIISNSAKDIRELPKKIRDAKKYLSYR